jgi:hypothetical protein
MNLVELKEAPIINIPDGKAKHIRFYWLGGNASPGCG